MGAPCKRDSMEFTSLEIQYQVIFFSFTTICDIAFWQGKADQNIHQGIVTWISSGDVPKNP